ncbi:MAG: glycosyltransferase [Patescibacteria group bacterium]|nr:glycosyltransferase [Patescibacteria group bacterium]
MKKILLVLPTYNEERVVKENTLKVFDFCQKNLKNFNWQILIADNGSSDATSEIAEKLSKKYKEISFFHILEKGRGYALKKAWSEYSADIYTYMDIDLATDLKYFPLLIKAIAEENYDLAIGSRLKKESQTQRSFQRELMSRIYNLLLKIFFQPSFQDAQCGFKAISQKVSQEILPKIKNNNWFFDSELLILAEKSGFKIKEIPVEWMERRTVQRKSTVKVLATAWEDIQGMIELKQRLKNF